MTSLARTSFSLLSPPPSRATFASAALLLAAFFAAFYYATPTPESFAVGLPLIALGMAIRLATNATLRKNETVFRQGLYTICRHPMYVGTLTLAAGIAIVLWHPVAAALFAAAFGISLYRIRKEEAFLTATLPDYADYRREVPAFPTPRSVHAAIASGRWRERLSLRQCFMNGEILRLNLYFPLLVASGVYLERSGKLALPSALLAAGAACSLLITAASFRWHPPELARSRLDYVAPACLSLGILAVVLA